MLIALHIDMHSWENAFQICKKYPAFAHSIYLPYAEDMRCGDHFQDAVSVYRK